MGGGGGGGTFLIASKKHVRHKISPSGTKGRQHRASDKKKRFGCEDEIGGEEEGGSRRVPYHLRASKQNYG